MGKWHDDYATECGHPVHLMDGWDAPRWCPDCKAKRDSQWYETTGEHCGHPVRIRNDWTRPPLCKGCKDNYPPLTAVDGEGHSFTISSIAQFMCAQNGWQLPTKCKDCKEAAKQRRAMSYDTSAEICGHAVRVRYDQVGTPKVCRSCKEQYPEKQELCPRCGKNWVKLSTKFQIRMMREGWQIPPCDECKHDHLLIRGAVGALRDRFPFPLETTIEQRGLIFTDTVAVVRNRRTGEVVAEVKMDTEGIIFVDKVAVTIEHATGDKVSTTREASRGFLFPRRTADTHDAETGEKTHRTEIVTKGILFPKRVAETTKVDEPSAAKATTRSVVKGFLFPWKVDETDKDD